MLEKETAEKLYILNDSTICAVAGMTADAGILINHIRVHAQNYLKTYNNDIPIESMVKNVCDVKQGYTQHGGLRPFGVSFLIAGWDDRFGFQLYSSNPSGNYSGWKATCIGGGSGSSAQTLLKQEYKDDLTMEEAMKLAVEVLSKTTDSSKLTADKVEFATVTKSEKGIQHKIWHEKDIEALLKKSGVLGGDEDEPME